MIRHIVCPACGENDELTGSSTPEGIRITCDKCAATWLRDATPVTCANCGRDDVVFRPQALTSYSRGTQVSILGWRHIPLCPICDADMLTRSYAGKPMPTGYRPAALDASASTDPDDRDIRPR